MSPELKKLEELREQLEKRQSGPEHSSLIDIALTHVEAAIGAMQQLENRYQERLATDRVIAHIDLAIEALQDLEADQKARDKQHDYNNNPDHCEPVAVTLKDTEIAKLTAFGKQVWELFTNNFDSLDEEACDEVMEIALEAGLAKRVPYDPEKHGDCFEADPGQEIWWWGQPEPKENQ